MLERLVDHAALELGIDPIEIRRKNLLGDDVLLAPNIMITAANYRFNDGSPVTKQAMDERDVIIGDDVWIGYGAVVLAGVTIGDRAIIGNANDEDETQFEPHYTQITAADQVQIYENIMAVESPEICNCLFINSPTVKDPQGNLSPQGRHSLQIMATLHGHYARILRLDGAEVVALSDPVELRQPPEIPRSQFDHLHEHRIVEDHVGGHALLLRQFPACAFLVGLARIDVAGGRTVPQAGELILAG